MKRLITLVLALLMALSCFGALAEFKPTPIGEIGDEIRPGVRTMRTREHAPAVGAEPIGDHLPESHGSARHKRRSRHFACPKWTISAAAIVSPI